MVQIKEISNGVEITETIDGNVVVKLMSHQSKPFIRTTNETDEETYQIIDKVGEIYNIPTIATDFVIIDANDNVFIPGDGVELIAYSKKIRAFRPDADVNEVLAVGPITTTSNSVTLGLHASGTNAVRIDGLTYEKYYPDLFNFTPVTTGEKILIIHALPDSQVFHLAQGAESAEAIEPSYNGLFVARILVNSDGAVVTENNDDNFKTKTDDTVYPIIINVETGVWVYARFNTFEVLNNSTSTTPILFGLISDGASATVWNGKRFYIKNSSGKNLTLKKEPTPPIVGDTVYFSFSKNITLKDGETIVLFLNRFNELEPLKFIGGSASFPETGTNGDVLEKDSASDGGVKWSNRLTNVETNKQDKSMFSALVDKWIHYWDAGTQKMQPILKLVSGVVNQLEFSGRIKADAVVLPPNANSAIANRLRSDGNRLKYANDLAVEKDIAYVDDYAIVISGYFNPPTLAQLASLGVRRGYFYKHIGTGQVSICNGDTLDNWYCTVSEWNALSVAQKNAVKNFNVY